LAQRQRPSEWEHISDNSKIKGGTTMRRIPSRQIAILVVGLAVVGGWAISAQDKYTVKVPNRLAFSEFRGYEA
jgi:hypothetical protein